MYQRRVTFTAHGLYHAEGRQRVDETRRALGGCGLLRQNQTLVEWHTPILGVHAPTDGGHRTTQQSLRRRRGSRLYHHAGTLIAHRQRQAQTARHPAHQGFRNRRANHGTCRAARTHRAAHIRRPQQQPNIRWVDRASLDANNHVIRGGHRCFNLD